LSTQATYTPTVTHTAAAAVGVDSMARAVQQQGGSSPVRLLQQLQEPRQMPNTPMGVTLAMHNSMALGTTSSQSGPPPQASH
jgi:hypothetical protein